MPYIDVNDVYILDNTGKQVDDAVDYALANSNRNLLDNPWFTYPINQRGFTSGNTVGYTVDRWKNTTSGANVALTTGYNGYISIPANCVFAQYFESTKYASLVGRTVTLSAMLSDGTVTSGTVTVPVSGSQYASGASVRMAMDGTNNRFIIYPASAVQIRAVKLELGSYSTLANDVPPDYGEELRKCQYFFRRITVQDNGFIAIGWATSATAAQFPNILGTSPMRAKPSATPTGAVYVRDPSGTDHAVSSFTVQYDPVTVCLQANTSGLTANTVARLRLGAGGRIDLSADL